MSKPWRIAWFLFFCVGLNYADRTAIASMIPPLRTELGLDDKHISWLMGSFLWTYALASPFVGNLGDRFSRAKIVTYSLIAWSLATIVTGFAHDFVSLLVYRTILGVAESFYLPAAVALLASYHGPATRGKAMGLHMMGLNVGLIGGGAAAGYMAQHYGWRVSFWVLGGLGLLLAFFSTVLLQDDKSKANQVEPGPVVTPKNVVREAWGYCLRVPSFYCMLASAMAAGVASWIFLNWLSLYFVESYEMTLASAALVGVALYKLPVFAGVAAGGWMSDKLITKNVRGRALIKGLSFIVSAPFLFLFMGTPAFFVVAIALVMSSAIRAIGQPSEHPLICEVIPESYRSTAVGIFNTCGSAAGGLGVVLAGNFKQDYGLNFVFGSSSFIYIVAGFLMLLCYWVFLARDMARAKKHDEEVVAAANATA